MTDDDWQQQRDRAIMAAFQTGRPVFADSKGTLRYIDGAQETLADDIGVPKAPLPAPRARYTLRGRVKRWLRKPPRGDSNGPPLSMAVLALVVASGLLFVLMIAMLFGGD